MEIIKAHHAPSQPVKRAKLRSAMGIAEEMAYFVDWGNKEGFKGNWQSALALSHCQVSEEPLKLFVVNAELAEKQPATPQRNSKNFYFPARAIYNAKIIDAPSHIERTVPKREVIREGKEVRVQVVPTKAMLSNVIRVDDGCMSYPHRTVKKTDRYHTITVRYQIVKHLLGIPYLKTITEKVQGLKAHIFQHEVDHSYGIDIYFGDGENKDCPKPYAQVAQSPVLDK